MIFAYVHGRCCFTTSSLDFGLFSPGLVGSIKIYFVHYMYIKNRTAQKGNTRKNNKRKIGIKSKQLVIWMRSIVLNLNKQDGKLCVFSDLPSNRIGKPSTESLTIYR
jgi:hypothetical protein